MEKSKIIADIFSQIRRRNVDAHAQAEQFRTQLDSIPEYAQTDTQLRRLNVEKGRLAANGESTAATDKQIAECKGRLEQIAKQNGITADLLKPNYFCRCCNDSGIVDGKYCQCFNDLLHNHLAQNSGSNPSHTFENSAKSVQDRLSSLYEYLTKYCQAFPDVKKPNCLLMGYSGCGKTYALNCVANRLTQRGFNVVYVTAYALNQQFLKHFTTFDDSRELYYQMLFDCDLLIIDDLATEPILNKVTLEYLFSLLNERNNANLATMVSTNLSLEHLSNRYGERIVSRLVDKQRSYAIMLTNDDLRHAKRL